MKKYISVVEDVFFNDSGVSGCGAACGSQYAARPQRRDLDIIEYLDQILLQASLGPPYTLYYLGRLEKLVFSVSQSDAATLEELCRETAETLHRLCKSMKMDMLVIDANISEEQYRDLRRSLNCGASPPDSKKALIRQAGELVAFLDSKVAELERLG